MSKNKRRTSAKSTNTVNTIMADETTVGNDTNTGTDSEVGNDSFSSGDESQAGSDTQSGNDSITGSDTQSGNDSESGSDSESGNDSEVANDATNEDGGEGEGNDAIIPSDSEEALIAAPVAEVVEDYELYAKQVYHYNGNDKNTAWAIFCQNFNGMMRYVGYSPDMNLLTSEQRELLKAQIA